MKTNAAFLAALSVVVGGCMSRTVSGDGHVTQDDRALPAFSSIQIEDGLDGTIETGNPGVLVEIDQNLQPYVETFVAGGALRLRTHEGSNLDPTRGYGLHVRTRELVALDLSGGSRFSAVATPVGIFPIGLSGGSVLDLRELHSSTVCAELSGGSELQLDGEASELVLDCSGGSVVTSTVLAETAHIDASGGSVIRVHVSHALYVDASGGSEIVVYGRPSEGHIETSGGSTVKYVDET